MTRVAVVTDSASDLPAERAASLGVTVVPLLVRFGEIEYQTGVDITTEEFWAKLTAPDAPFPTTAAASPGIFQATFERLFSQGTESIVCVTVGGKLSATLASARIAADALRGRDIHLVDSEQASMAEGILAEMGAEMAAAGAHGSEVSAALEARKKDVKLYVVLETLEYLRRGGRISAARAALGTMLSVKPIITLTDGVVEQADRVRTRSKARERLVELLTARPIERIAVLHAMVTEIETFAEQLRARSGVGAESVTIQPIGPTVGPHVGPGAYGAVVLYRQERPG